MGLEQYAYSEGDAAWYNTFLARCEQTGKGLNQVSLTNYNTTVPCVIASGSVVEIDGAVFIASSNTSVIGAVATGLNYIIFSVTGTTATPYLASTVCSWDDAKQGYYTDAERMIAGFFSDGALTAYQAKWLYYKPAFHRFTRACGSLRPLATKTIEIGDWDMDATVAMVVAHSLTLGDIRTVEINIRNDTGELFPLTHSTVPSGYTTVGQYWIDATSIKMSRVPGEYFDDSAFDTTPYNRGWITIEYADGE